MATHYTHSPGGLPAHLIYDIDEQSDRFTTATRAAIGDPDTWSAEALAWLCMEHFQFSKQNPVFLKQAAHNTEQLPEPGISAELRRNFEEEKSHAQIYHRALADIGVDVETRREFAPTTQFLQQIAALVDADPSRTLGAMYATETAAIFEHEVFRDISVALIAKRNAGARGKRLIGFHDMHLAGVEQAHKDNLGVFLHPNDATHEAARGIDAAKVRDGADVAVRAMTAWWGELLSAARRIFAAG